jgi:hypothetical protein
MIPNLTSIIMIIATAPMLILLMFLPAFIELNKPKDRGPRVIPMGNSGMLFVTRFLPIANMEDEQKFDSSLIQKMAKIVDVLPSLEV